MISVYADGSSTGRRDRPGGFGWVILENGQPLQCGYGGDPKTTNNVMELTAAIKGLEALAELKPMNELLAQRIELVCDSEYTLKIASGEFSPQKNLELAIRLRNLARSLHVITRWVKGHSAEPWNERCDRLAKRGKEEQTCQELTK